MSGAQQHPRSSLSDSRWGSTKSTSRWGPGPKAGEISARGQVEIDVVSNPAEFIRRARDRRLSSAPRPASDRSPRERARKHQRTVPRPVVTHRRPHVLHGPRARRSDESTPRTRSGEQDILQNDWRMLCGTGWGGPWTSCEKAAGRGGERIGQKFSPGLRYGGSCVPMDVKARIAPARNHGLDFTNASSASGRGVMNDRQKRLLAQKAGRTSASLRGKKVRRLGTRLQAKTETCGTAPASALTTSCMAGRRYRQRAHAPVAAEPTRGAVFDARCSSSPQSLPGGWTARKGLVPGHGGTKFRQPRLRPSQQGGRGSKRFLFDGRATSGNPKGCASSAYLL